MILTDEQIRQMMPNAGHRLDAHLPFIDAALTEGHIDTPQCAANFMAQAGHESGEYLYMHEIADGSAYEWRADLGNTEPGDGPRYRGGGPFQITGRRNYRLCGDALGLDLIAHPELIQQPEHATRSAVWFWNFRELSLYAERDWFVSTTKVINGGTNGLTDRLTHWYRNCDLLGLPRVDISHETDNIRQFQRDHGLTPDGAIGPNTLKAMRAA